jgi:hypothetical protein
MEPCYEPADFSSHHHRFPKIHFNLTVPSPSVSSNCRTSEGPLVTPLFLYAWEERGTCSSFAVPDIQRQTLLVVWLIRGYIRKFPDWVDNEIYAYKNKHSLRSNAKGYGGKFH